MTSTLSVTEERVLQYGGDVARYQQLAEPKIPGDYTAYSCYVPPAITLYHVIQESANLRRQVCQHFEEIKLLITWWSKETDLGRTARTSYFVVRDAGAFLVAPTLPLLAVAVVLCSLSVLAVLIAVVVSVAVLIGVFG